MPLRPSGCGACWQNPPRVAGPAGGAVAAARIVPGTAPPPEAGETAALPPPPAVTLPGNTPEEKYNYAYGMLLKGMYPEAEEMMRAFVQQYPKDKLAGNALY